MNQLEQFDRLVSNIRERIVAGEMRYLDVRQERQGSPIYELGFGTKTPFYAPTSSSSDRMIIDISFRGRLRGVNKDFMMIDEAGWYPPEEEEKEEVIP